MPPEAKHARHCRVESPCGNLTTCQMHASAGKDLVGSLKSSSAESINVHRMCFHVWVREKACMRYAMVVRVVLQR
jgi:hypothetical protein